MSTEKHTVAMSWDGSNLTVVRSKGDKAVEIREFSPSQYPRAQELFVELATDKCKASFRAPHPTREETDAAGETAQALVEAVGLLVRVTDEAKVKNDLLDDIEEFVERMAGQEGDDDAD